MTAKETMTIAANDVSSISDLLKITPKEETVKEEPVKTELPKVTKKKEIVLNNNERSPANWKLLPDGDNIVAQCGSLMFKGTTSEFSAMLRSGIMLTE